VQQACSISLENADEGARDELWRVQSARSEHDAIQAAGHAVLESARDLRARAETAEDTIRMLKATIEECRLASAKLEAERAELATMRRDIERFRSGEMGREFDRMRKEILKMEPKVKKKGKADPMDI
jgi:FtsZ-binding cell division protein ZapB